MNDITARADWIEEKIGQHAYKQHGLIKDGIRLSPYRGIGDIAC